MVYLKWVLKRLNAVGLRINIEKCEFLKEEIIFLGFKIGRGQIWIDPSRIKEITDFKIPTNRKELQRFLGFIGYLRRFIQNFSLKVDPLYKLLKKDRRFVVGREDWQLFS